MTRTKSLILACAAVTASLYAVMVPADAATAHREEMMRHQGMMQRHGMMPRGHMMHRKMMHRKMMHRSM